MPERPKPPATYRAFIDRFPELGAAWERARVAEEEAPFDEATRRLLKLAVAVGNLREGAVHSAVRKARAAGATEEQIYGVVALAASTLGFPSAVAVFSWVADELSGD
ncbi:MAG: carboxymuconolactone decarboxylase family protein [Thermoanaerobaculia bacterium]